MAINPMNSPAERLPSLANAILPPTHKIIARILTLKVSEIGELASFRWFILILILVYFSFSFKNFLSKKACALKAFIILTPPKVSSKREISLPI